MYLVKDTENDFETYCDTIEEILAFKDIITKVFGEYGGSTIVYEEILCDDIFQEYANYLEREFPECANEYKKAIEYM